MAFESENGWESNHDTAIEEAVKIGKRISELESLIRIGQNNIATLSKGDERRSYSERNLPNWEKEKHLLEKGLLSVPLSGEEVEKALESLGIEEQAQNGEVA